LKLQDKVAIVTGGGRGIGKAIALAFAQEGADIVIFARSMPELRETANQIQALGRQALAISGDVSSKENVDNMVRLTLSEFGTIDILINNAGIQGPIGPMVENDVDHWIQTISTNLIGQFLCAQAVLPVMIQKRQGKIINLSGGGSTHPRPYFTAYSASKAAVVRFTETLAEEVKEFNIQVNAIAPGAANTRLLEQILAAGEAAGEKALVEAREQVKTGGTPLEKPTSLAVFMVSDEFDGLTGRLISAVYDDWSGIPRHIPEIMASDYYTMRRISPKREWR